MKPTIVLAAVLLATQVGPSPILLPNASGGIGFDDLRFSNELHKLLVPAGRTGLLDLVDPGTGAIESIEGFSSAVSLGREHEQGTTSADVGQGYVFAIDRTKQILATVDPGAKHIVARTKLGGGPDYVRWVGPAEEVWVTEPGRKSIETFRFERGAPPRLTKTATIHVADGPEASRFDDARVGDHDVEGLPERHRDTVRRVRCVPPGHLPRIRRGFGSDMRYAGIKLRARGDQALTMPAGTSVAASAHAVAGTDPWPIHAREAEEENKKCNVCHFPQPFAIPERTAVEIVKPVPRAEAQEEGITCASRHLTPEGKIRGPHKTDAPHETVADERMSSAEMCAFCHSMGKRVPGKQTQTYLEWRDDFAGPGLGRQQCQDCHMPRTQRKTAEDFDVPVRAVARHLWTGGHSGQRLGSALSLVMLQPRKDRAAIQLHVVNVGAGHSVPTGSNRRAIYFQTRVVDPKGKKLDEREWMFAPWYGPRPDDRAFLKEDEKRPDRVAATQADEQGPHEAPIRAGEERVLTWEPKVRDGRYTVEATLVYDLNRYNDRSFKDQRDFDDQAPARGEGGPLRKPRVHTRIWVARRKELLVVACMASAWPSTVRAYRPFDSTDAAVAAKGEPR